MIKKLLSLLMVFAMALPMMAGVASNGSGTKADPYTVAGMVAQNNSGANAWVKAFIVGQLNGSIDKPEFEAPFTIDKNSTKGTNIIIAATADERTTFYPVQLPKGAVRDALNLPENPDLVGAEVMLYGSLVKYFTTNGMKSLTCAIVDGVVYGTEPAEDPTTPDTPETPDTPDTPTEPEGNYFFSETFESSISAFTADNKVMPEGISYVWAHDSNYKCAKASAYVKGTKYETESWLISPAFQIQGDATLSFEHAANYIDNAETEMTLYYTTDNGTNWTKLDIPTYPTGWTFVSSGDIVLPATTSDVKIAFVYKSSTSNACTWQIKNVKVVGSTTGVDVVLGNDVNVLVKGGALYVEGAVDGMVNIYSVAGVMVKQVAASQADGIVLPRGLYLVQVNNTVVKVIL